jgi:hypothetical protein
MPAIPATNAQGDSDAHSGLCDFGDRDGLNRAGGGPDVRSGLSGLPARVEPGELTITNAATRRYPSATRRHRAARLGASSIRILRARECLRDEIIAVSIKIVLPAQH